MAKFVGPGRSLRRKPSVYLWGILSGKKDERPAENPIGRNDGRGWRVVSNREHREIMKAFLSTLVLAALVAVVTVPGFAGGGQEAKQMTALEVKSLIQGLGFTTKDLETEVGKEKIEFMIEKGGYNVFIGAEVSPSKRFIWLTTLLGAVSEYPNFKDKAVELLAANGRVQPSFFYTTTKGNLMIAMAVDNRNVDPATMRQRIDKLATDVSESARLWKK